MAHDSPENPCAVTSHNFSYMVKLLFLRASGGPWGGLRDRREEVEGCEHTRILLRPLASAVVLVWIWPISWMRFNERRIGAEAWLLLCFNEPSARLWTSDRHSALWTPNDTSIPCGDGAAKAIIFHPVWWNIQATPFCHPGVTSGPAFMISLERGEKPPSCFRSSMREPNERILCCNPACAKRTLHLTSLKLGEWDRIYEYRLLSSGGVFISVLGWRCWFREELNIIQHDDVGK